MKGKHKGKPWYFFNLQNTRKPNEEQMNFIFEHYPEYGAEKDF
jgi:hypothetical protein